MRKRLWARENPPSEAVRKRSYKNAKRRKEKAKEAGAETSKGHAKNINWYDPDSPNLSWFCRISVPFSYAASKNHIYTLRKNGHVALRKEARQMRSAIATAIRKATANHKVANNKLWLDILVQKPNHRGDAVNVIDLICDAIKDAIPLDDRWYCIRKLDWEIVKKDPQLYLGIGQESQEDCQICSYCGQIKPLDCFNKSKQSKIGVGRECKDCRRRGRIIAKQGKQQDTSKEEVEI